MTREHLLSRLATAAEAGIGYTLSADELRLMLARPEASEVEGRPRERLDVQIRWLCRKDMAAVLRIEQQSFEHPWTEEDFLCCLRQHNCIGMVAEYDHEIVGFMIYELHKSRLQLLNVSVDPEYRRRGVGRQLVDRLIDQLSQQRRKEITLLIRESNLDGQRFFASLGFRAVSIVEGEFEDCSEDAYRMTYRLPESADIS